MKRIIFTIICILLAASLGGCGNKDNTAGGTGFSQAESGHSGDIGTSQAESDFSDEDGISQAESGHSGDDGVVLTEDEAEDLWKSIRMPDAVYSSSIPPILEYESLDEYFESDAHTAHLEYLRTFSAGDIDDEELADYVCESTFDTETPWLSGVEYADIALGDVEEEEPEVTADTDYAFLDKYLKDAVVNDLGGTVMYMFDGTYEDAKKIADECRENGFCENVTETDIAGMYSFMGMHLAGASIQVVYTGGSIMLSVTEFE